MTLLTKEHYDLIAQFDKQFKHRRLDKELKELWGAGHIYQDGFVNDLFLAYRSGYAYARAIAA